MATESEIEIVHLLKTDSRGGAFMAARRIHDEFRRRGVNSSMIVGRKYSDDPHIFPPEGAFDRFQSKIANRLDDLPLRVFRTPNLNRHSPAWVETPFLKTLNRLNPDVVFLHWICGGFLKPESLRKISQPMIWRLADMWAFCGAEHYTNGNQRYVAGYHADNRPEGETGFDLNRWVWNRKKTAWSGLEERLVLACPSRWMAACVQKSDLFRNHRVEVITTGHDLQIFRPQPRDEAFKSMGMDPSFNYIGFGADDLADPRKGFRVLIEALHHLRKKNALSKAAVITFGSVSEDLRQEIGLPIFSWPRLQGQDLIRFYTLCRVFIAPSLEENLANTVLEAISVGRPVVAFNIGGMPDVIEDGRNGFLASSNDAAGLAAAIEKAMNARNWEGLCLEARKIAEERCDLRDSVDKYQKLAEEMRGHVMRPKLR